MRPAVVLVLGGAAVMAVLTGVLMSNLLTPPPPVAVSQTQMVPVKPRTVNVLVAGSALEVGRTLTADNFEWQEWPDGTVRREQGVAVARNEGEKTELIKQYEGTVLRSSMIRNEPFSEDKVLRPAGGGLLALVLSPGMRSSTVSITAVTGAGGMVQPGDRVDLLLTMDLSDPGSGEISPITRIARPRVMTETILQNLKIIARDRSLNPNTAPDSPVPANVTFEVTLEQAEVIATAARIGIFSLVLRPLRTGEEPERVGISVTTDVQAVPGLQASRRNIPLSEVDKTENPFIRPMAEAPRQSLVPVPPVLAGPPPGSGFITINRWTAQQVIPTMNGRVFGSSAAPNTVLPPVAPLPVVSPVMPLNVPGQAPPVVPAPPVANAVGVGGTAPNPPGVGGAPTPPPPGLSRVPGALPAVGN